YHIYVAKKLHQFDHAGYKCLVFSVNSYKTLNELGAETRDYRQRAVQLAPVLKQLLLGVAFIHSAKLTHNNINWSNVMVSGANANAFRINIINFSLSQPIRPDSTDGVVLSRVPKHTLGFSPPEAYADIDYDLRKQDTWSVMATAVAFYKGKISGNTRVRDGVREPLSQKKYEESMRRLHEKHRDTRDVYPLHDSIYALFQRIVPSSRKLFTINNAIRPIPEDFVQQHLKAITSTRPYVA
ncbi:hypothetical protein SYNPS1DRAFT_21439, partial [Syncephalis pseudoplumigaleata]